MKEVNAEFQKVKFGWIPKDWEPVHLGDLADGISSGKTKGRSDSGICPVYGSTGIIGYNEQGDYEGDAILVARVGANAGKLNLVSGRYGVTDNTIRITLKNEAQMKFIWYQLENRQLNRLVFGSGQPLITGTQLKKFLIASAPVEEQQKIASILSTWDHAIDLTEKLIAEKQARRRWLVQQLLMGKKRLKGFKGEWREIPLGEVTEESKDRNHGELEKDSVRAVSKAEGMIPMKEHIIADNLDRYKIVDQYHFAYNPMRINIGSICFWEGYERVIVSPDYVVFRCKEKALDPFYMNFLRQTHRWDHYIQQEGNGSVRVRIYYSGVASLKFKMPSIEEQRQIVKVLGAADLEIDLLTKKLEALQEQKKGLMQKLLTGKIRVKGIGGCNE